MLLHSLQNFRIHRQRNLPRRRILLARMINPEQPRPHPRQIHFRPMPKRKRCPRRNKSLRLQNPQIYIPPDFPQRQNRPRLQNLQLALKVRPTMRQLARQRLVVRGSTPRRRRNVSIQKFQPIVALHRDWPVRKSRVIQRAIQKLPRLISRKRPPRPIRTVRTRCQPHQHQLRVRIAKSRHRLPPINPISIRPPFLTRHRLAIHHQSRTLPARDNLFVQNVQQFCRIRHR